ncbi:FMN reductase (NADPH) [Evansella caseinilytica]|uniref:FMN reductase (NADPH) n=1 Tax=Evansella caseinilytica TaxID=1503961 RepID=A0A1H3MS62_9BACI|nr:oxygen-insensitive NADPH nitroreductase [Evansella caseinilytica]SDY79330.1 FMN reductase (NADPH) [Evansella caseinilytica]
MNDVINTIMGHRSVRQFKEAPLSGDQVETIVKSAQMASTSSYLQAYTIIGIKNRSVKAKLAELAGNQTYVEKSGHFFVFCADLHRHQLAGQMENVHVTESLQTTEKFMVAVIDASLAAQNAALAAESIGLGICYIGAIRNHIEEVSTLLKLPDYVIPLFGLAVGIPAEETGQKPRLPLENVYHEETYETDETKLTAQLSEYNETISSYYEKRTNGRRNDRWTEQMARMLAVPKRIGIKTFLKSKLYMKKN